MPLYCEVERCQSSSYYGDHFSFHRFPKGDAVTLSKWISAAGKPVGWKPRPSSFVCGKHFPEYVKKKAYDGSVRLIGKVCPQLYIMPPVYQGSERAKREAGNKKLALVLARWLRKDEKQVSKTDCSVKTNRSHDANHEVKEAMETKIIHLDGDEEDGTNKMDEKQLEPETEDQIYPIDFVTIDYNIEEENGGAQGVGNQSPEEKTDSLTLHALLSPSS